MMGERRVASHPYDGLYACAQDVLVSAAVCIPDDERNSDGLSGEFVLVFPHKGLSSSQYVHDKESCSILNIVSVWLYKMVGSTSEPAFVIKKGMLGRTNPEANVPSSNAPDEFNIKLMDDNRISASVGVRPPGRDTLEEARAARLDAADPLVHGRWHHVSLACVYDRRSSVIRLFLTIDGKVAARVTEEGALPTSVYPVAVAERRLGPAFVCGASIQNYSAALDDVEMAELMMLEMIEQICMAPPTFPPNLAHVSYLSVRGLPSLDVFSKFALSPPACSYYALPRRQRLCDGSVEGAETPRRFQFLVCHDMAGGYQHDRHVQGLRGSVREVFDHPHSYAFTRWQHVDMFVYFSHMRVSIPPPGWVNAAHRHGVKILGTFITEWESGAEDNLLLLGGEIPASASAAERDWMRRTGEWLFQQKLSKDRAHKVDKLGDILPDDIVDFWVHNFVAVAKAYHLDGWFINIESGLETAKESARMALFVRRLTLAMHALGGDSPEEAEALSLSRRGPVVVWYDSITDTGELKWQNCLNARNKDFFESCDGLFTNYAWDRSHLTQSLRTAECSSRTTSALGMATPSVCTGAALDVLTGTDVFGRGTFGGGGFYCGSAIAALAEVDAESSEMSATQSRASDSGSKAPSLSTSAALFAPGWTHERAAGKGGRAAIDAAELRFWSGPGRSIGSSAIELAVEATVDRSAGWVVSGDWSTKTSAGSVRLEGEHAIVSGHEWCIRSSEIDLLRLLISTGKHAAPDVATDVEWARFAHELLEDCTSMTVQSWYRGTPPNCADRYRWRVELRDEHHRTLSEYDSGDLVTTADWLVISHRFHHFTPSTRSGAVDRGPEECARPAPRFLFWQDRAKDAEHWGGHFGAAVGQGRIVLETSGSPCASGAGEARHRRSPLSLPLTEPPCLASLLPSHPACARLPFYSNFAQGVGRFFCVDGRRVSDQSWYDMGLQAVQPTYRTVEGVPEIAGDVDAADLTVSYECSFDGGSALKLVGDFPAGGCGYASLKVFDTCVALRAGGESDRAVRVVGSFAFRHVSGAATLGMLLELKDGDRPRHVALAVDAHGDPVEPGVGLSSGALDVEYVATRCSSADNQCSARVETLEDGWKRYTVALDLDGAGPLSLSGVHLLLGCDKIARPLVPPRSSSQLVSFVGSMAVGAPEHFGAPFSALVQYHGPSHGSTDPALEVHGLEASVSFNMATVHDPAGRAVGDIRLSWHVGDSVLKDDVCWHEVVEYFDVYLNDVWVGRCCSLSYTITSARWSGRELLCSVSAMSRTGRFDSISAGEVIVACPW